MNKDRIIKVSVNNDGLDVSFAVIAIGLCVFLFHGEPDISDSLRVWAGKQAGTIHQDYKWPNDE